jgi:hypothetical protein
MDAAAAAPLVDLDEDSLEACEVTADLAADALESVRPPRVGPPRAAKRAVVLAPPEDDDDDPVVPGSHVDGPIDGAAGRRDDSHVAGGSPVSARAAALNSPSSAVRPLVGALPAPASAVAAADPDASPPAGASYKLVVVPPNTRTPRFDRAGRVVLSSIPVPTRAELREMSPGDRGMWHLSTVMQEHSELLMQHLELTRELLRTPPPPPPVAGGKSLLTIVTDLVLQRFAHRFRTDVLNPVEPRTVRKTFSEQVPLEVALHLVDGKLPHARSLAQVNVVAPISDTDIEALLVRGGGARARHLRMPLVATKHIDRVVAMFDGKISFRQRSSSSVQLFETVKLKISFRYILWYPLTLDDGVIAYYPKDGTFLTGLTDEQVLSLRSVPLYEMTTVGPELIPSIFSADDSEDDDSTDDEKEAEVELAPSM